MHCGIHEPVLKGGDEIPTGHGGRLSPGLWRVGREGRGTWRGWGVGLVVMGGAVGWAGLL